MNKLLIYIYNLLNGRVYLCISFYPNKAIQIAFKTHIYHFMHSLGTSKIHSRPIWLSFPTQFMSFSLTSGGQLTPEGSTMWPCWLWVSWLWLFSLCPWLRWEPIFLWLGMEPACMSAMLDSTASQPSNPACVEIQPQTHTSVQKQTNKASQSHWSDGLEI